MFKCMSPAYNSIVFQARQLFSSPHVKEKGLAKVTFGNAIADTHNMQVVVAWLAWHVE